MYCRISPLSVQTSQLRALRCLHALRAYDTNSSFSPKTFNIMSNYLRQHLTNHGSIVCRVELFFDSCEEMKAWIQEKDAVLSDGDLGRDLETVRALQRRHQVNGTSNRKVS